MNADGDHPYALTLREKLVAASKEDDSLFKGKSAAIFTDVEGQPGDLVNCPPGRFHARMKKRRKLCPWILFSIRCMLSTYNNMKLPTRLTTFDINEI